MKLYAISDLHLGHAFNRDALEELPFYPQDWLILAGDTGETAEHLQFALSVLTKRFAQVIWVPGNHDLWTLPTPHASSSSLRGEAKYHELVSICRKFDVLTPEDPYAEWPGDGGPYLLAPLFLLYDYSFRPDDIPEEKAIEWALEADILCSDEYLLHPDPYSSRSAWCEARCLYTERRLKAVDPVLSLILINHFPLCESLVRLERIPRFSLWCGTRRTNDWHRRFSTAMVVYGHLHLRGTTIMDHVRFEEVSLGYPQQWDHTKGVQGYLRQLLPPPEESVR